jgi:hypothetical protein
MIGESSANLTSAFIGHDSLCLWMGISGTAEHGLMPAWRLPRTQPSGLRSSSGIAFVIEQSTANFEGQDGRCCDCGARKYERRPVVPLNASERGFGGSRALVVPIRDVPFVGGSPA